MMRVAAVREVGGFRTDMIAGEEPELCFRLREAGCRIRRIEGEMVLHDAAMTRFGQWWRRAARAGHAYAEGAFHHGRSPERYCVRPLCSIAFWGGLMPAATVGLAGTGYPLGLALLLLYPILWLRIVRRQRRNGRSRGDSCLYATSTLLAKLPQLSGASSFVVHRCLGLQRALIEHKNAPAGAQS